MSRSMFEVAYRPFQYLHVRLRSLMHVASEPGCGEGNLRAIEIRDVPEIIKKRQVSYYVISRERWFGGRELQVCTLEGGSGACRHREGLC